MPCFQRSFEMQMALSNRTEAQIDVTCAPSTTRIGDAAASLARRMARANRVSPWYSISCLGWPRRRLAPAARMIAATGIVISVPASWVRLKKGFPSGAKAHSDWFAFTYGLKPVPFKPSQCLYPAVLDRVAVNGQDGIYLKTIGRAKGGSLANQRGNAREVYLHRGAGESYGLRAGVLGPIETLAQSVSAMAPTTSPSLTIPLVFALAGNATWFVYLLATVATLLVGFCVSQFARLSASPGSLYTYTANTLPPVFGVTAAWGLLLAYLATGASVAGGALYYASVLSQQMLHWAPPALPVLAVVCAVATYVAYRDVKLSAELMLWIEIVSVSLILIVLAFMLFRFGLRFDVDQFRLKDVKISALGPALVLSMFSFVGFESAASMGAEARDPLRTIPRAVLQCAILAGVFFMLCSYSEVLGFRGESGKLSDSTSPLHLLAAKAGVTPLGVAIDFGAMVSMFACVLACTTAAARVLMRMARGGLLPAALERTSRRHGTPGLAVALSGGLVFAATMVMSMRGVSGSDMYDLLGSLSVFGFLTAYALVALALPFARRALGRHSSAVAAVSAFTVVVMILIVVFDLRSASDAAHARIPYIYLAYIAAGLAWYVLRRGKAITAVG
jgi:amino acid transporter